MILCQPWRRFFRFQEVRVLQAGEMAGWVCPLGPSRDGRNGRVWQPAGGGEPPPHSIALPRRGALRLAQES